MKLSFAVCTHNEGDYIEQLLSSLIYFISQSKNNEFEIVVLDDFSDDEYTKKILEKYKNQIKLYYKSFNNDFAEHKNYLNSLCTGEFVFNIDADEMISPFLLENLITVLENNSDVDVFRIPRINIVDGLTLEHARKWGWVISKMEEYRGMKEFVNLSSEYNLLKAHELIISEEDGLNDTKIVNYYIPIIMFPDYQTRIYRNNKKISWINKVHEQIIGYENWTVLPPILEWSILHRKDITRQEKQNNFYDSLI